MRNFKAQVERDLLAVFHNSTEFADEIEFWIDGIRHKGPVILDDCGIQDRNRPVTDHVDGLSCISLAMYVPLSILHEVPKRGMKVELKDGLYEIGEVNSEVGEIVLYLQRLTE